MFSFLKCNKRNKNGPPAIKMHCFRFSNSSIRKLNGINQGLQMVAKDAIQHTPIDFGISWGIRTAEQQNELFRAGKSQRDGYDRISKHQLGHAFDAFAVKNGKANWDFENYILIAEAIRIAAIKRNVRIRWGGSWTVCNELKDIKAIRKSVSDYVDRKRAKGQKPFIDSCHFELA